MFIYWSSSRHARCQSIHLLSEFRQHVTPSLMIRENSSLVSFSTGELFDIYYVGICNFLAFIAKNVIVKLNLHLKQAINRWTESWKESHERKKKLKKRISYFIIKRFFFFITYQHVYRIFVFIKIIQYNELYVYPTPLYVSDMIKQLLFK